MKRRRGGPLNPRGFLWPVPAAEQVENLAVALVPLLEEALSYKLWPPGPPTRRRRGEAKVWQRAVAAAPPGREALNFDVMFPKLLVHRDVSVPHKLDVPRLYGPFSILLFSASRRLFLKKLQGAPRLFEFELIVGNMDGVALGDKGPCFPSALGRPALSCLPSPQA